jgi:hypothetical protein
MKRSWALVAIGAWLAGTICMSVIATENFYTIDRLLGGSPNPAFRAAVPQLGQPLARDLLRYLSSELNRLYFQLWNIAQLAIGAVVLWLIARDRAPDRVRWLTPAIVSLGRSLDFVPRDPAPPGMRQFWVLHAAYTSLEMIKLLVGVWVAYRLSLKPLRVIEDVRSRA